MSKFIISRSKKDLIDFSIAINENYMPNWHHEIIASKLESVERGEIKRLMIFMPPRHGKSQLSTINFPAWFLGRNPQKEIITASYSSDLAIDFGMKTRDVVRSEEYQAIFNTKLKEDQTAKSKWLTDKGGGYVSVGVGGGITGKGANILLIDDPLKNREEAESQTIRDKVYNWYTSTAFTRLEKNGAVVLIMTRWHKDDLAGRLIKSGEWDVVNFPAIAEQKEEFREVDEPLWSEKYDLKALEEIKKTVGIYDWSALYQQHPISSELQEFKESFFKPRKLHEVLSIPTANYLSIDTAISKASSADYTGFCINLVDRDNNWNIIAWQERINPKELMDRLFNLQKEYNFGTIGIEKTIYKDVFQFFLDDEMRKRNVFLPITELEHRQTAKETRIRGLIPRYESGSIYHIEGRCSDLEEQLLNFPQALHDDIMDAEAYQFQIAQTYVPMDEDDTKTEGGVTASLESKSF